MTDWNKLERSESPLTSTVEMDELTEDLIRPFDYNSTGTEVFHPYLVPDDLPKDFGIGVIVGASGTGKSTLLKSFGRPSILIWESKKSIASHFETPEEANEKLSAAGLMSVPEWITGLGSAGSG